jgi:2-keto-4-pentenoate hydratase/2-oxohepta-3-ene-1,7-dioic acid hydratase in catechol pathway
MRIIRFIASDGRVVHGEEHDDGTATVIDDAQGILDAARARYVGPETLRGKRALVADDDQNVRTMVSTVLERVGCRCNVCSDGAQAMQAIEHEPFDLIVSDITMPHHNGYEIYSAARSRDSDLPILLITGFGYDPSHSVVRAANQGLKSVLYKPFTPTQLLEELQKVVHSPNGVLVGQLARTDECLKIDRLLAPIRPSNVICVGRNYPTPDAPDLDKDPLEVFMKPTTAVQSPDRPIALPHLDDPEVDCEGELAVIIGAYTRHVSEGDAPHHILGYTIGNDITARRFQVARGPAPWMRGKGFDTFCPLGPAIVTSDQISDPQALGITTRVNGEIARQGNTRDMLRSVWAIVSQLSQNMTLAPGTVILTGASPRLQDTTAATSLQPGDEVEVEIESIGVLANPVEAR